MSGPAALPGEALGAAAVRLSGLCAVVLGWSPDAFWRATPAEVRGVVDVLCPAAVAPMTRDLLEAMERSDG